MISGSFLFPTDPTHSLFPWKAYIAHFLAPTSLWMKLVFGSHRLLLGCPKTKQSSSNVRPAARIWWLVLTTTLKSDCPTPQRARTGQWSHLFVRAGPCGQTYCSHKSNGLCSCSKHTASSNINTSVCEYPGSVLLSYVCLPVYLNWTCICSPMGRFISVLVLFIYFFNIGEAPNSKHLTFPLQVNLKIISNCFTLDLKPSGRTHPCTSTSFWFNKPGTLLAGRISH